MEKTIERMDMAIAETEAVTEVLLYLAEEASDAECAELRPAIVALLYMALDLIRAALRDAGRLAANLAGSAPGAAPA